MKTLLSLLVFCCSLMAQLPAPPLLPWSVNAAPVGSWNLVQNGYAQPGMQEGFSYCHVNDIRVFSPSLPPAIGIGGTIYYVGASLTLTGSPFYYPAGTALSTIAIAPWSSFAGTLPGAGLNNDGLTVDPTTYVLSGPTYQTTVTSYDEWVFPLAIPNVPGMIGTFWEAQTLRIDPVNGLFYLSNGILIEVRA